MRVLRLGDYGNEVKELQVLLQEKGFALKVDGQFGEATKSAVADFQRQRGLIADGIVGNMTWAALNELNDMNFEAAANMLGVDVATIKAVHYVESGGRSGFLPSGRPMILFEGHVFWNQLKQRGINPIAHQTGNEDILFPNWDKSKYKGGEAEHPRLEKAERINKEAALASASWGMFQIMGFNYNLCGYNSVQQFVDAMKQSRDSQLQAFVAFIKNTGLAAPLRNHDWATFAYKYNGAGYKQNQYDTKLAQAYNMFK